MSITAVQNNPCQVCGSIIKILFRTDMHVDNPLQLNAHLSGSIRDSLLTSFIDKPLKFRL